MILRLLENSRVFLVALLIGALVLLVMTASELGGELPNRAELKSRPNPMDVTVMVRKIETLFAPATLTSLRPVTNGVSPFYTTHFQPPGPPPKAPDSASTNSATKKIQLTYQGVYQTAAGEKKAFVKVGDKTVVGSVGAKIVSDWTVAEIALRTLILKNAAAQTNLLEFNMPKEIEVPNP